MWNHYKRIFPVAQLVTGAVSLAVYQTMANQWVPAACCFMLMQIGAVAGALWAHRWSRKLTTHTSCLMN
jgi:hypothetical protein